MTGSNTTSGADANKDRANLKDGQTEADAAALREVNEAQKNNKDSDVTVTRYFTKDGVPVEPSSIPADQPFGPQPDVSKRPDVEEKKVPVDESGQVKTDADNKK